MLNNVKKVLLKLLQIEEFKDKYKELEIRLILKLLIKLLGCSKKSQQNNSEKVTNEQDKVIPNERYTYLRNKDKELLMI